MKGEWIAATPRLQIAPPPQPLHPHDKISINHTDMSDGGVYTQDQVAEFSRPLNYPKVRQAIKHRVVNELCDQSNHYLCLKLKDTIGGTSEKTNIFNFHQHMRTFLHTFGEITSIIITIWIII